MIHRFSNWLWTGIEPKAYKDRPGSWLGVTRQTFTDGGDTAFEARYFEVGPGGYTSYERHRHEHLVMVVRGAGSVRLGAQSHRLGLHDVVRVPADTPHQFACEGDEPLGIVCVVDRERDRPVLLSAEREAETSKA